MIEQVAKPPERREDDHPEPDQYEQDSPLVGDVAALGTRSGSRSAAGAGDPVDPRIRAAVEARTATDLRHVRVHSDRSARDASDAIDARAFTFGSDIYLGYGETQRDSHLVAHELVHAAQQGADTPSAQRQTTVSSSHDPAEAQADAIADDVVAGFTELIVDGTPEGPEQMTRTRFLAELEHQVTAAANSELGPLWSAVGCPYIASFFERHRSSDARQIERLAQLYSGVTNAKSADAYFAPIVGRVRSGVQRWRAGADVSSELESVGMGHLSSSARESSENAQRLEQSSNTIQRVPKGSGGAAGGRPLDAGTRTRMGNAFGANLSQVRVHSGPDASRLAAGRGARALTTGNDIVFGAGQYRPGTIVGDAVLAHELSHVIQQQGGSAASGHTAVASTLEHDADVSAAEMVARLHAPAEFRPSGTIRPRRTGPLQIRACSNDLGTLPGHDTPGRFHGQAVGYRKVMSTGSPMGGVMFPTTHEIRLIAADTLGYLSSEGAAIAMAAAGGPNGGAVTLENGEYVAYRVKQWIPAERPSTVMEGMSGLHSLGTFAYPGVVALVSAEGTALRPGEFGAAGEEPTAVRQDAFIPEKDPFAGFREAFGNDDDKLDDLDESRLLLVFNAALRANALDVVAHSELEVTARQQHLAGGRATVSQGEIDLIHSTIGELIEVQTRINAADAEYGSWALERAGHAMGGLGVPESVTEKGKAILARKNAAIQERALARMQYPVLARYESVSALRALQGKDPDLLLAALGSQMPGILKSIVETRNNILNGKLNLWAIPALVDSTMAGLQIDSKQQREWIDEERKSRARNELIEGIVLAILSIGFSIGAVLVGGPAGLALAAGALGLGVYDAVKMTDQYLVQRDASNTAEDPAMSLLDPELAAGWGWLVVAWAGVLLDVGDVARLVAQSVKGVAKGGKSIAAGAEELAQASGKTGDEAAELALRLRHAAGDFDVADVITHANKGVLAKRIGTHIEIDASLPAGEVRVLYRLDDLNNVQVLGCKASPTAKAMDVAAHAGVVTLLRRYNGVAGRFRQLWDQFRAVLGVAGDVPPASLQKGSEAWESFMELSKHRQLLQSRTSRLGTTVSKADEAALRADVEFFEWELAHHARVVRQASTEAGQGFIASAGRRTKEALEKGYRLPDFPDKAASELTDQMIRDSNYYYRAGTGADDFTLVRKADRKADALRGNPDGTFDVGELSRADRAKRLLDKWGGTERKAFDNLNAELAKKGARLVPLEGMTATGQKMSEIVTSGAPANFGEQFIDILVTAQTRAGVSEDVARVSAAADLRRFLDHDITVVRGTDQLRAFGYRSNYMSGTGTTLTSGQDLHHLVPLYLGGGHRARSMAPLPEDLHRRMHQLVDEIKLDDVTTLAPHSIQRANFTFQQGAAILHADGSVELLTAAQVAARGAPKP